MGKTETIKRRTIYVYLPSIDQKKRWEDCAKRRGTSISKFVIEHVENSLRQGEDPEYWSAGDLWKDLKEYKDRVKELEKNKRVLEIAMDRLEQELRRYRAQPFLDDDFEGVRRYDRDLVQLLRSGEVMSSEEILSRLNIEPMEYEAVKSISKQLELLGEYGLVKPTPRGWKWVK